MLGPLEVLEAFGIRLERDQDTRRLTYTQDADINRENVLWVLNKHRAELGRAIDQRISHRNYTARNRCFGGPLDGKRNPWSGWSKRTYRGHRVARAKWAVYLIADWNPEARFIGYATSEAKAKRGIVRIEAPPAEERAG